MDELYVIIGKLYADLYSTQKYIELLQNQIKEKDKTISDLRNDIKSLNDRE